MSATERPEPELSDEAKELAGADGELRLEQLYLREFGPVGREMRHARRYEEERQLARAPHEGLRERKRRLTRQRISDAATALFLSRGFDEVRISDVAEIVGVSEKTIYNYFPTKESLVLDGEDELVEVLTRAFRERGPNESLSEVTIRALGEDMERFDELPEEMITIFPRFGEMLMSTPSLRAAWLDLHLRVENVMREELARSAEVDPHDPEPTIAAHALIGLSEVSYGARMRHITAGLRGTELRAAVSADVERAARMLETGLWSFNLLTQGRRHHDHIQAAAEEAREQVMQALRQARVAFRELRARAKERT